VGSNFWLSHKKEKSPLTHGLNYRSAFDVVIDFDKLPEFGFELDLLFNNRKSAKFAFVFTRDGM